MRVYIPHSCYSFSFADGITIEEEVVAWLREKGYQYRQGTDTQQTDARSWKLDPYLEFWDASHAAEFKLTWM